MNRVHHDDEGRVFLRDTGGHVWRMTMRADPAPESPGSAGGAPTTLHRVVEFRAPSGRTVSVPFEGEETVDALSDEEILGLFRRAQGRRAL